jgi:hypothetical protein
MQLVYVCDSSQDISTGSYAQCDNWIKVDYTQFSQSADVTKLQDLLVTFSPETFAAIVAATLVTFITGHVAGAIVKLMNRT